MRARGAGAISEAFDERFAHHVGRLFHQGHFLDIFFLVCTSFHPQDMCNQFGPSVQSHGEFRQDFR